MKYHTLLALILSAPLVPLESALAGETLFSSGPQVFAGQRYYWLAEWRLEVTLPQDVGPNDRFEVLFGSKGPDPRTLHFTYNGKSGSLSHVEQEGYAWLQVPLGELLAGKQVTLYGKGQERVAFLSGVRVRGKSSLAPKVKPIRTGGTPPDDRHSARWSKLPGFEVTDEARVLWNPAPGQPDWQRAERSAGYAGIALSKVQRWLRERCMAVHDKKSGLFRPTGREWNYRDTAADCYPFYIWAAFYTDQALLNTVMIDTLAAEQRLCNHLDRLPVRYDMDTGQKIVTDFDAMIFGASEYAKDGLIPIVEITGKDMPWFERMRGLVDDIFKHARIDTPYGKIPSTNIEVNGELLQLLPRLYCMTQQRKYLDWAHRLADHYLLAGGFVPPRLSDHGCEIIGGLGLLFAVDMTATPAKAEQYKPHLQTMFDEILRRGTNSDGIIIRNLQPTAGPHDATSTGDGWGYDFVGFLDYDLALGTQRYDEAIRRPLTHLLKPRYLEFNWDHGSRDNVADSVEGGLYLLYRSPVTEGFVWADREMATLLVDHTDPERLWGVHKLEANTVRTVLIHTMLHTRNTIARPWHQGLQLGAAPCGDGICVLMKSEQAYDGLLQFDIPRHRLYMGFQQDWPRMNAVPEWFTVEPDDAHQYSVEDVDTGKIEIVSGKSLSEGLPVRVRPDRPLRLVVTPCVPKLQAQEHTPAFARENLVAWCIVPFDKKQRGPQARAEMLRRLGLRRVAYDWREEHVPTFEQEILAYQQHGLEFFAFWGQHERAFQLFEKYQLHPQIWITVPSPSNGTQEEKIEAAAQALWPLVERTQRMGSKLGLYNHGQWGGQPENMVAVCQHLRQRAGTDHVGIVYNFHHAHDRMDDFEVVFPILRPYLLCLNLNGMNDNAQPKILPIGQGQHEKHMIDIVIRSGYQGPIGIIDHRNELDTEESLKQNLDGLDKLLQTDETKTE